MEDALERAMAYEKVGVDAIFLVGVKSKEQLEKISDVISIPIILGGGGSSDMMDLDYLSAKNVRICLQGHQPFSAAVKAIYDTMKALREGTPTEELQGIASAELMGKVTKSTNYENMFDKYLK
jgi:carboxyvinyl-carboxyphosphonate phosphorylmutase